MFWVNVPLALIAMAMIHFSLPSKQKTDHPEKVDVVGGVLLAIALGLVVVGTLQPGKPDGKQVFPSYGLPLLIGALVAAVAFFVWERFAKTRLIEPAGVHFRPFLAALGASLTAGAALMVTLVNVELFGQGVLGQDQNEAAFLLAALPDRTAHRRAARRLDRHQGRRPRGGLRRACLIAAGGYYLIAQWPVDLLAARHDLGFVSLPVLDTDLAIAGLGLGLVIGAADVGDPARGALRAARHRVRGGGGGPHDRHAGRHRGAQRVGSLPVQPAPHGAASCTTATERRDSARARRRCSDAV